MGVPILFTSTETELEQIYHSAINLKLKKDLIKKVQENYNPSYSWLRVEELEAVPELMAWLIENTGITIVLTAATMNP